MYALTAPRLALLGSFLALCRLETIEVSAWIPSCSRNLPSSVVTPSYRRNGATTTIYSKVEDTTETSIKPEETASTNTTTTTTKTTTTTQQHHAQHEQHEQQYVSIAMPKIQYTVPGMKRGWKEDGVWMDEDGPRNGPPQNFWRQQADERVYEDNMQLLQDLLQLNSFEGSGVVSNTTAATASTTRFEQNDLIRNDLMNGLARPLEKSNSIRRPSLNRLILGDWAPIVRGGKVVATGNSDKDKEKAVDVPYRFHVQRTAGKKLAPKTHYGTFDMHLEAGEEITVQELLSNSNTVASSGSVEASPENENKVVKGYTNANDGDLYVGGITYVSKYVMIMRQQQQQQKKDKGPAVKEVWMRVDPKV